MARSFYSLAKAFEFAELDNCNRFKIWLELGGQRVESVMFNGSNLFHEDALLDYRAELSVQLYGDPAFGTSGIEAWSAFEPGSLGFEKTETEDGRPTYRLDLVASCGKSLDDLPKHLDKLGDWISSALVNLGVAEGAGAIWFAVEVTDAPSFDKETKWEEFAYEDVDNWQLEIRHRIEAGELLEALGDYLQAVYDAIAGPEGNDDQEDFSESLMQSIGNANEYCSCETDCSPSTEDFFFEEDFGEGFEELIGYQRMSPCDINELPLKWRQAALESNPFVDTTSRSSDYSPASSGEYNVYWTAEPDKAKKYLENVIRKDAKVFRAWAEQIRKSVAGGNVSEWLP